MRNRITLTFLIFLFSINSFSITCVDDDFDLNQGDLNSDSYTMKAKTANNEIYSDLIKELSGTTYTDMLSSDTKGDRVYGVNASWTSTGSNVVSISYSE